MPDLSGRPTLEDGLKLARSIMVAKRFQAEQEDRIRQQRGEDRVKKYLNLIAQGQKPDPKADKDFDYGDYLKASAMVAEQKMNDQAWRQLQIQNDQAELVKHQQDIDTRIQTAEAAAKYGDIDKAYQILAPVYNYVPDGHEFVGFKEGTGNKVMIMKDPSGKEYEQQAPPFEEAMAMAKALSPRYVEMGLKARERMRQVNLNSIKNPQVWETEDGKKKAYYVVGMDPRTGRIMQSWKDPKTGKTLKGFDEETGKWVDSKLEFYPSDYLDKKSERVARSKARFTTATRKVAGGEGGAGQPWDKNKDVQYIKWLAKAYNITIAKATDIYRHDKSLQQRIQGFVKDAEYLDYTGNVEEDNKKVAELKKKWGLEKMENIARLPADKKKRIIEQLNEKFPPGDKYKDGTKIAVDGYIFTIQKGRWTR